jgi:hypothetical protein
VPLNTPPSDATADGDDFDPDNWGISVNLRHDDPDRAELEAQYMARLRARVGDEVFGRLQKSRALSRSPRPLTSEERAVLQEALAPLLRDMEATGQALPDIREEAHADRGGDAVCAWIQDPGGAGQGISVCLSYSPAQQLCDLAEQLQAWAGDVQVDPGRRPWPGCPDHPGSHMLSPQHRDEVAVWCCPDGLRVIAGIGMLTGPGDGRRSRKAKRSRRNRPGQPGHRAVHG